MSFRTAPRWLAIPVLCLGAAGVFAQQPGSLIQVLPPPAGAAQESAALGMSVAMNATYTVAGAPFDDLGGQDSGVVKVFDTATGDLLHVLVNPSPNTGDQFGHAVAISGSRVVVGACQGDSSGSSAGRAYVYDLGGSNPTVPVLELSQPAPVAADQFGYSVAISGNRVAVSANLDDTGATNTGRVFIYNLAGANPQTPSLIIPNPTPVSSDLFGQSISLDGGWLVVGVPQKDLGGTSNVGSVELFNLDSATPATPVASLLNPHPAANDTFGNAVSVSGTRFVAGTSLDDATGVNSGRAYDYDGVEGWA